MSLSEQSAMHGKVLATHWIHDEIKALFDGLSMEIVSPVKKGSIWTFSELIKFGGDADAIITCMADNVDHNFLSKFKKLKIVSATLKGYDNYDVEACTKRGIWLTIVPDAIIETTAEHAIGLTLCLIRNTRKGDHMVRRGDFEGWRPIFYGRSLRDSTIGIVGGGELGMEVGRLLTSFHSKKLLYADTKNLSLEQMSLRNSMQVNLEVLFERCQVVIVCLPLVPSTYHIVNESLIKVLPPGSYMINVGRGSTVDESAVLKFLNSGQLEGYAADVFEMEDWAQSGRQRCIAEELREHPNTIFSPHLGSAVDSCRRDMSMKAAEQVVQALKGYKPMNSVNNF